MKIASFPFPLYLYQKFETNLWAYMWKFVMQISLDYHACKSLSHKFFLFVNSWWFTSQILQLSDRRKFLDKKYLK